MLYSSVVGPDPHESAFILIGWIRIQEGKNDPQKWKIPKFWNARCSLLRDEVSCSVDVLYGGLGISKLQFLSKPWIRIRTHQKY